MSIASRPRLRLRLRPAFDRLARREAPTDLTSVAILVACPLASIIQSANTILAAATAPAPAPTPIAPSVPIDGVPDLSVVPMH